MPDWTALRRARAALGPAPARSVPARGRHAGPLDPDELEDDDPDGTDPGAADGGADLDEQDPGDGPGADAQAPAGQGEQGGDGPRTEENRLGRPPGDPAYVSETPAPRPLASTLAHELLASVLGADALAAAVDVRTPGGRPVLAGRRAARAAAELAAMDPHSRERVAARLRGAPDVVAAYLLSTLATGRGPGLVEAVAEVAAPHSRDAHWLHRHLGVIWAGPGPATYEDDTGARLRLRQLSPPTAGPAAMIVLRVLVDPAYGYWLTTGVHLEPGRDPDDHLPFEQRFRSQQTRVQEAVARRHGARTPIPRLMGPPPSASARFLNRFTRLTGVRFAWLPVDGGDPAEVQAALAAVGVGFAAGVAVPLYVGGHADRTVVLALSRTDDDLRLYDPSRGEVLDVPVADVVAGRPVTGGWDRLEGVLAPSDT